MGEPAHLEPLPAAPAAVSAYLGERMPLMHRYAERLADTGVSHGLVGPREVPRLWERHILNCAVVSELIPAEASVIDVGSGAGLPGIVLAIARPDLQVTLVEPLLRRVTWLGDAIDDLEIANVQVVRSRAEQCHGTLSAQIVTSRAVARLDKLAAWCLPLVTQGGSLLAVKGSLAHDEIDEAQATIERLGGSAVRTLEAGVGVIDPPTTVVAIEQTRPPGATTSSSRASGSARSRKSSGRRRARHGSDGGSGQGRGVTRGSSHAHDNRHDDPHGNPPGNTRGNRGRKGTGR